MKNSKLLGIISKIRHDVKFPDLPIIKCLSYLMVIVVAPSKLDPNVIQWNSVSLDVK